MANADVYRCHVALSIPTNPNFGSLNLAAAVQLIAYEGLPHNIGEAVPERCAEDVLAFLLWRFGMPSPALHAAKPH